MSSRGLTYRYRFTPTPGYEFISPEVQELLGHAPDRFYADPDFDLKIVHPDDRARLQAMIEDPGRSGALRWLRADGSVVTLEVSNLPVYGEGRLVAAEGMARVVDSERTPVLTDREVEILSLVMGGLSDRAIGVALQISRRTVEHHLTHIRAKLDVPNRTAAVATAWRLGLLVDSSTLPDR